MGSSSSKREPLRPDSASSAGTERSESSLSVGDRNSGLSVIQEDVSMRSKISVRENDNIGSSRVSLKKSKVSLREPEVTKSRASLKESEVTKSKVSLRSNNDLSHSRTRLKEDVAGSKISIKEKIDKARSTISLRENVGASTASLRKPVDIPGTKSAISIRSVDQSTFSLRSVAKKSTLSLRSDGGDERWSNVQKSSLSVRKFDDEDDGKPKNIFEDGEEKLEGCEKVLEKIWSIRNKKRNENDTGELYIKTTLKNLIVYMIFLAVLSIVVYGMVGLINFYFSSGMLSLFIDQSTEDGPQAKTFRGGFINHNDIWNFLTGPLLNGLHFDKWYDLSPTSPENSGYIFYQNKLLGRARLMQIRVKDHSCKVASAFSKVIDDCRATYSARVEDREDYGKALTGINSTDITYDAWKFQKDAGSGSYSGSISTYPGNGYMINLGEFRADSLAILNDLKDNKWIDDRTRALIVDFTVYNGNVNLFNQIRLVMEFPSTGGVLNTWVVRTSKLLRYVSDMDYFIACAEGFFVLFIIYFTIEELLDIRLNGKEYLTDPFNLIDWFILALSYTTCGFSVYRTLQVNELLDKLLTSDSEFESFDQLTYVQELFNQCSAVVVFFSWVKIFKYISLNKTLDHLSMTMSHAGKDIGYFCIILSLIFMAYAILGHLIFGEMMLDYQEFFKTLFTLFRILLGDFNFKLMKHHYPIFGPIFFMSFIFIGVMILLNMFLAIINESYAQVKEQMDQAAPELMLSDFVNMKYGKLADKVKTKRSPLMDADEILRKEEIMVMETIDFSIWRQEMKKKGYSDMEIEEFFSKYDKDGDLKLNYLEKLKIVRDIKKAKSHIKEEFAKRDDDLFYDDEEDEHEDELRQMCRDDFDFAVGRIDRMETSIANIINKLDKLFSYLEDMEVEKMKKRKEMSNMLSVQQEKERKALAEKELQNPKQSEQIFEEDNLNDLIGPQSFN